MLFPFYLSRGGARVSAAAIEEEFNVAFPFAVEENFELGTLGVFTDTSTDTLGKISVIGPTDAHEIPPYLGGFVMEVDLNRGATDAYVSGETSLNIATGNTRYARLMVYLSDDLKVPGATDSVRILQLCSGAGVEEAAIGLVRGNKGELMIGIFSPDFAGWINGIEVERNMWLPLEIAVVAAGAASRLEVMVLGSQVTAVSMNWATLTSYRIGAITQSLDIRGKIWFDHWVVDNSSRLVAPQPLDPTELDGETILITKTSFVFVGPGEVDCLTLIAMPLTAPGTTSDNAVYLYDTDRLPYAHHDLRMSAKAAIPESIESKGKKVFKRGCYAVLAGTATSGVVAPSAIVQLGAVTEYGWGAGGEEGF